MTTLQDRLRAEPRGPLCDEAADRIDALVTEKFNLMCQVAALQKDAERYRWIRVGNSEHAIMGWFSEMEQWVRSSSRHADKVIDAAIAAEKDLK